MNPPKIEGGFLMINIPLDSMGPIMAIGYMELAKDSIKEYFARKQMEKMNHAIMRPNIGVIKPN